MTVTIPYKTTGSQELRYALRSIERFIENPEVYIIGRPPGWVKNVNVIEFNDNPDPKMKERNIFRKIMRMESDFLFFNDDFYLLRPFDKNTYHYSGNLSERIAAYAPSNYYRFAVQNTLKLYGDIDCYYRHGPIYCRRDLLEQLTAMDWTKPWGYCIKSTYCHLNSIEGTDYPDLKFKHRISRNEIMKQLKDREYFSTDDPAINIDMIEVLNSFYPTKSQFEK